MSKILSYNNKTTKTADRDWIPVEPYDDDDIKAIRDPNGGMSENPHTAIPSPFAQLDLVKNAFAHLAASISLAGTMMDKRLVSNALDVAQLLFNYESHRDYLHIVRWNRDEQIARLKSEPEHRLYGDTLDLFLLSDTKYNFNLLTDWYIVMWHNRVIGATSPSSFTMGVPRESEEPIGDIMVEQGVPLFAADTRHLWQRDADFVRMMYLLFNAYPVLRKSLTEVYAYMIRNLDPIRQQRPELYASLVAAVPNMESFSPETADRVLEQLEMDYDPFAGDNEITLLGARLYHKRAADIMRDVAQSDFMLAPTLPQPAGTRLPLVLRTGFSGSADAYKYVDRQWNSATEVLAAGVPIDRRKLPDTAVEYPFVTTSDLLTPSLVRLSGPLDGHHYFDGNAGGRGAEAEYGYLLPLTPLFFKYFTAADLCGKVCGRNMLDIEERTGGVTVTLRIPVRKRCIEFTRNYHVVTDPAWTFDERRGSGRLVTDAVMSAAVFPFVKTGQADGYTVQLFAMGASCGSSLQFYANGLDSDSIGVSSRLRTNSTYSTEYFDVKGSFDLVEARVNTASAGTCSGFIVPRWQPYAPGSRQLVFAVDFGTTNSHLEWAERGHQSEPLDFGFCDGSTLIAPLLKRGSLLIAEQLQRIEFLPSAIDSVYGFPLRSALASNAVNDGGTRLWSNVNIPFLYERQYFDGYDVATNLKWKGDTALSREFLRELALLIRAKALIENADLGKTDVVYFFPVSMGGSDRRKLQDTWEELYRTYIGPDTDNLHAYPESIAPAYYYKGADVAGSSFVTIDIGGGTSDTVIYQPTPDRLDSVPVAVSSFRFAGNAIFGDAFTERDADNNPLIAHYAEYFSRLVTKNPDITYLNSILQSVLKQKRSEDVNAFLFSVENVEQLRQLQEVDRNLYSYDALLRNDDQRKLVFMYFYAAIIYYTAQSMLARGYEPPKQIYFSGTGSKILSILGTTQQVREFTQRIIEEVMQKRYTEPFDIKVERECPKQVTCRGGVRLENERLDHKADTSAYSARNINRLKYCFSMIGSESLTYGQVNQLDTRGRIADSVREFNRFFLSLCDNETKDEFGIEGKVFRLFASVVNNGLDNYLTAGINSFLKGRYEEADVVEDVPFFYPVIGVIRYNLLKNLCNEVISNIQ